MKRIGMRMARYFLQGLILTIPVTVTILIIVRSITWIDGLLPIHYPGLGLLIIVTSITILGAIGSSILAKPILDYIERLMEKAPLVKVIYTSVKDLLSAFVGKEKKFNQAILVKINSSDEVYRMGFITQQSLTYIGLPEKFVAVYLPHSYNFSGNLLIVPAANVIKLNGSSADIMKFVVSGGVTELENVSIKDHDKL